MAIEADPADELAVPYRLTATAEAASFGQVVRRLPGLLSQATAYQNAAGTGNVLGDQTLDHKM
ncbi:hypothetical protein AB0H83_28660 [Dactylosporangium sp. NPDC050688]|uniref:hypothetical protein n=1 Tax=Dactylosporangium sp. NPDC050688 TaxID=3157217 RepID=UPI0033F13B58